jgi:ATP-dependent DNA helicase RecQ
LLAYFGEEESLRCGKCDVCIERNKISLNELEFDQIVEYIKPVLRHSSCTIEEVVASVPSIPEDKVLRAMQWLIENGKIVVLPDRRYKWT